MVEEIEDDDEGIVEKMGADIDEQGSRTEEEVAQQDSQQQPGYEAVDVAVEQGEDDGRDKDCHMGVAEPAMEYLLQAPSEEEFLADGRDQGEDQQLEDEVGDGGEDEQTFKLLVRGIGEGPGLAVEGPEVPGIVPRLQKVNERDKEQYDYHCNEREHPIAPAEMKTEVGARLLLIKEGEEARREEEGEQLGKRKLDDLKADGRIGAVGFGNQELETASNKRTNQEKKKKPNQLGYGL